MIILEALIEFVFLVAEGLFEFWLWGGSNGRTGLLSESPVARRSRRRRLAIGFVSLLILAVIGVAVLAIFK